MAESIAEKLDFLMKLTGTQNVVLSRALSFDASYISRIRSGKRGLPPRDPFIEPASVYFARNLREDYQKKAAADRLHLKRAWPESEAEAACLLAAWLQSERIAQEPVERMIAAMTSSDMPSPPQDTEYPATGGRRTEAALFYGNAGKRDGVITFLSALCEDGRPHTLLLYSDEDLSWLFEDPAFARAWTSLLLKLADAGSKIKIIHSLLRDANEMWEAVRKWLPLYMTGAIEPYYYPRLRDGVFHRTLFIASDHSAMVANSVRGGCGDTLNVLLRDKTAVLALEAEFRGFLALCRPLMEIAYPNSLESIIPLLRACLDAPGALLAALSKNMLVCANESSGALVVKTDEPYAAFSLKEPRMVAAVEEYLYNLPGEHTDPKQTRVRLEAYIERLKNGEKTDD